MQRLLFFHVIVGLAVGCGSACSLNETELDNGTVVAQQLRESLAQGGKLDMALVTPFSWDRMHVFGPYSTPEGIQERLGFRWAQVPHLLDLADDALVLVVFVYDQRVVCSFIQPRRYGDLRALVGRPYAPQEAVFEIVNDGDGLRLR